MSEIKDIIERNDHKLFSVLLKKGLDVNMKISRDRLIDLAIIFNKSIILWLLLEAGAVYDEILSRNLLSVIHINTLRLITPYLGHGEEKIRRLNMQGNYGSTALRISVCWHFSRSVKYLIVHGASVNTYDYDKRSPLINCLKYSEYPLVRLLVAAGSDVNYMDPSGG